MKSTRNIPCGRKNCNRPAYYLEVFRHGGYRPVCATCKQLGVHFMDTFFVILGETFRACITAGIHIPAGKLVLQHNREEAVRKGAKGND